MKIARINNVAVAVSLYIVLAGWLFLTDPRKMPIIFLMVPFILLLVALWMTASLLLNKFFPQLRASRKRAITACFSVVPVFLLVLSSLNQLTWRDVVLTLCLTGFLLFYSGRIHFFKS